MSLWLFVEMTGFVDLEKPFFSLVIHVVLHVMHIRAKEKKRILEHKDTKFLTIQVGEKKVKERRGVVPKATGKENKTR